MFQSQVSQPNKDRKGLTLIVTKVIQTEPETALAGVILEIFLAGLKAAITTFNAEIVVTLATMF